MNQKYCCILIIDDSPEDCELYKRYLLNNPEYSYTILEARLAIQGLELWQKHQPDVVLLDYRLPDMDGIELLEKLLLHTEMMQLPVIMLTGQGDEVIAVQSLKAGAQDYLVKNKLSPFNLYQAINSILERTHLKQQIQIQEQKQSLLSNISVRIRQFLDLEEILQTAVEEVRKLFKVDRVIVYQFDAQMHGTIVAESKLPQWTSSLSRQIKDTCFQQNYGIAYRHGKIFASADIYSAGLQECHIKLLEQFEVRANLAVPILLNADTGELDSSPHQLWGLLIAHQCSSTREWEASEIDLLQQISVQMALAIKQAELYENLKNLNASLEEKVKQRTQQLEASEQRFRGIFDNSFQLTGLLTDQGILLEVNQTALNLRGLKLEDVIHKPFWETGWWANSPATQAKLKQAISQAAKGEFIRYEVEIFNSANEIITIDFSIRPLKDESGKVVLLIPEGRDISERKIAEAKLQLQAQMLHEIHDSVVSIDVNGIIQTWNHGAQRLFGYTDVEVIGQHVSLLYWPEDSSKLQTLVFEPVFKNGFFETELRNRTKSGKEIYISLRLSVIKDEQGKITRLIGCSNDITQRKQAKQALQKLNQELESRVEQRTVALRQSEQRFASLAAAVPVVIFRFNIDSQCIYVNHCWGEMTGTDIQLALGYSWIEAVHPDDRNRIHQEWLQALQGTGYYQNEGRILRPDGTIIWFYCQAVPEIDSHGQKIGYIGSLTDITARKQAEAQLHQTNEQLVASNVELARATRLKDEFLANMSHELRTPLNAVIGISEALQEGIYGVLTEKQKQSLQIIERSGNHLLSLINDILDLSKIEAGQIELNYTPTNISQLCQSSLAFIKQQAFQKRIQVEFNIPPQLPKLLLDERRIRQVLINLLNNAVKFTPEGGQISLEVTHHRLVTKEPLQSSQDFIRIAVIDTGIGIAPENLHKLFQPFVQIDSALNRQYNGTGLGLVLVKRLVELHNGRVEVNSEIGVGSCFSINLPLEQFCEISSLEVNPVLAEINSFTNQSAKSFHQILLAEDNEDNIFTILNYLEVLGYQIIVAKNGFEAITLTKAHRPDLILMDIQMPGMDGLEATKQIRLDQNFLNIPIIALTALAMPGDLEKCLAVGANAYLSKPVELKQLANLIKQLLA